jgi:protein phosphatase
MGTTLTAVYLDDSELAIAHVGDSRAYLMRGGELTRLTHDHSLVEELMRRGKLTPEQAAEHPQRSIITRALGIEAQVEVDTWTLPGRAGDVVLLCSDGLTSMIDETTIASILRAESDLDRAGERLIHEANEAGGRDNITVVLFRLEDVDGGGAPPPEEATMVGVVPDATEADDEPVAADAPAAAGDQPTNGNGNGSGSTLTVTTPLVSPRVETGGDSPRLARTQGRPDKPKRQRGESRTFKVVAALISAFVVIFLFGGGGYLATRELFFIGTNSNGIVTLYRGLPYDFVVPFYEQTYVSGLPASEIPPARRAALLNHNLRSQNNAITLIRQAERGQLAK